MAYAEKRAANPGALGLTIGLNAAAVLALALWNPSIFHIPKDPWKTINIGPPAPLPPPLPPETKPRARQQVERPTPQVETGGTIEQWHPETINPGPGPTVIGGGTGEGSGPIIEPPPLPPPHLTIRRAPIMATSPGDLQPPYPPGLQRQGVEGSVTVRILVGTDGRPKDIVLVRADDPDFFAAAKNWGMRHWRFKPAAEDGTATEAWYTLTVKFNIE